MEGIYCYKDLQTNKIVYIGKDCQINKHRRNQQHFQKGRYNDQQINRVLQNNPDRYKYIVLKKGDFSRKKLNDMEISYIKKYDPIFNFTKGGEGITGRPLSEIHKKKISNSLKGKNHPMYGKCHSKEWKRKISASISGINNPSAKYTLWDSHRVLFDKTYINKNPLRRTFRCKYNGKKLPIGTFNEFVSCEIIHNLILEAIQ